MQISANIMINLSRMVGREVRNEAELHSDVWRYKAKLEESVKDQAKPATATQEGQASPSEPGASQTTATQESPTSPSRATATPRDQALKKEVIAYRSRSDYTVYVLYDKQDVVISVVIGAKHTTNINVRHVIAQLIGYFAAFNVTVYTPLVFVLTEFYVDIVLFPFKASAVPLINAVVLPRLYLFNKKGTVNQFTLNFLLSFSKSFLHAKKVKLPDGIPHISMESLALRVQTERQQIEELQHKLKASARENAYLKAQIEALKAQKV